MSEDIELNLPSEEEAVAIAEKSSLAMRRIAYSVARERGLSRPMAQKASGLSKSAAHRIESARKTGTYDPNSDLGPIMDREEVCKQLSELGRSGVPQVQVSALALLSKVMRLEAPPIEENTEQEEHLTDWLERVGSERLSARAQEGLEWTTTTAPMLTEPLDMKHPRQEREAPSKPKV